MQLKISLCGDSSSGKTTLICSILQREKNCSVTVGVDFAMKQIEVSKKNVKLNLFDIAGQKRYISIMSPYYSHSHGTFIVFDLSNEHALESLDGWYKRIRALNEHSRVILVGNKIDLERHVSREQVYHWANQHSLPYVETSALMDIGVEQAVYSMVYDIFSTKSAPWSELFLSEKEKEERRLCKERSKSKYFRFFNARLSL